MRKDIEIHIKTGDMNLINKNQHRTMGFDWVKNPEGLSRYIYGEITIPSAISENSIRNNGVYVSIPYTPYYKEFMIRFKRVFEDGTSLFLQNQVNGSDWFIVKAGMYGQKHSNIHASELIMVSDTDFYLSIENEFANVYSAARSDVHVIDANRQNCNCLISCVPGNNYRYPLTGVGLIRWINATNINNTELAEVLKRELSEDDVTPRNAYYNYDTQQLELSINA